MLTISHPASLEPGQIITQGLSGKDVPTAVVTQSLW